MRLRTRLIGGRRYCCDAWLEEFVNRLNGDTTPAPGRTPADRTKAHRRAPALLEMDGL